MSNRRLALTAIIISGAAVALAIATLAWVTATYDPPAGAARPNLADWMQAWGSVSAVLAGLAAAVITAFLLRHEMREARRARTQAARERVEAARDRERLDDERRDAEMAQARTIVVGEVVYSRHVSRRTSLTSLDLRIENCGTGPILNTQVWLMDLSDARGPDGFMVENCGVIKPGCSYEVNYRFDPPAEHVFAETGTLIRALAIDLRFRDMYGRRWSRFANGQPVQLAED